MLCSKCKIEIPSGTNYCWKCGEPQKPEVQPERVRITFSDLTGSRHADVTLRLSLTADDVVERLKQNNFLVEVDSGQVYVLQIKRTGSTIQPGQTLASAGVQEGDTIIAGTLTRGGGGIPIRSFREIQLIEGILNHNDLIESLDGCVLFAVILYTNEDKTIALYIREHVRELHSMSGNRCIFFVIEEPSSEWRIDVRKYLGALTDKYFDTIWKRLGADSFQPFDKSRAYEIAERFGVKPNQLPCIVFFSRLQSQESLIVELNQFLDTTQGTEEEFAKLFRAVFSGSVPQQLR